MKIAVFHNFMDNIGGAEMVALSIARGLDADIFTTNISVEKISAMGFADVLPRIHSIGRVPKMAPFRQQLALWRFRRLDLDRTYDFYVIAGDWAVSGAVKNKPNLWYVHSPLNELWEFKDRVKREMMPAWQRPAFEAWVQMNRRLTQRYARHVEHWACNSKNTSARIARFYGREAAVIYPPTDLARYRSEEPRGYWLSVNRLLANKRIDVQLAAFAKMPNRRLIVVGSYEKGSPHFETYRARLDAMRPANVTILNWVDRPKLTELYARAVGVIAIARDEDFGMSPIEAMASGKPVIASNEGGYKETVIDGSTGVLLDVPDSDHLIEAVTKLETELQDPVRRTSFRSACQTQAGKFDESIFLEKIRGLIPSGRHR